MWYSEIYYSLGHWPQMKVTIGNFVYKDFVSTVLQAMETPYDEKSADSLPTLPYEFPHGINKDFGSER